MLQHVTVSLEKWPPFGWGPDAYVDPLSTVTSDLRFQEREADLHPWETFPVH